MMFKRLLPLVALVACSNAPGDHPPPPDSLIGTYHYSGSGSVAGKFPWEARSKVVLDRDGQYTFGITIHIDDGEGGETDSDEDHGWYRVEGDQLILEAANRDAADEDLVFEINGNELVPSIPWPARLALKGFRVPDPVFVRAD